GVRMRKLSLLASVAISLAIACVTWGQNSPTAPTTQAATQPLRRQPLGIYLMDANRYPHLRTHVAELGGNLFVNKVLPGSRAERMGMRQADVIKGVNGKPMHLTDDIIKAVQESELL